MQQCRFVGNRRKRGENSDMVERTNPASVSRLRGVNREDIRQSNLSLILTLTHKSQKISRSTLTQITGLNRSTISDLVAELVSNGLVLENEDLSPQSVGRPSILVTPNPEIVSLAFSPDKFSATLGAVSLDGKVLAKVRRNLAGQPDPFEMANIAYKMAKEVKDALPPSTRISGIGATVPGPVNVKTGAVSICNQLDWFDVEFGSYLSNAFRIPSYVDNDSTVTCAAERDFGAGRDFQNSIYLYGGSGGIGGGVVINGTMLRGATGFASELGHLRISDSKIEDTTGLKGTLEALVRRDELLQSLRLKDVDDEQLKTAVLKSSNPKLKKVIDSQIDALGVAIANLVNIFNPEAVLLSGFLSVLYEADDYRLLSRIREGTINGAREKVVIRTASLGSSGILIGAAELAFAPLLANPSEGTLLPIGTVLK